MNLDCGFSQVGVSVTNPVISRHFCASSNVISHCTFHIPHISHFSLHIPHSSLHIPHVPHLAFLIAHPTCSTFGIPHCTSHMFHISQSLIAHFHIPLFFEFWRYNLCLFQLKVFSYCLLICMGISGGSSIQGENTKWWRRQQASKYYGTVKPLPIMFGKVLGKPVRASQVMCVCTQHNITGKGKAIPWH
jgi:hypothetical protein